MSFAMSAGIMNSVTSTSSLLSSLVSYWKLDEASGDLTDSTGGNNGSPQPAGVPVLYSQTGIVNTSVRMQADLVGSSRIDMGDPVNLRLTSAGSISCWLNPESVATTAGLVAKMNFGTDRNGYGLFTLTSQPYFEIADATSFNSLALSDTTMINGSWYHIVITWDGSTIRGYVNGTVDSHTTVQSRNATSTGINFTLGRGFNGTDFVNYGLTGKLDEVGLWSRAITGAEVTTLYNSGTGRSYPF